MRTSILSLFLVTTFSLSLIAQKKIDEQVKDSILYAEQFNRYQKVQLKLLDKYNFKEDGKYKNGKSLQVISPILLNKKIEEIFNQLVFSNGDLVNNASAFGYSQDKDKTKISVSNNFKLNSGTYLSYLKVGANASGTGNVFNLYSDDTWRNNVGISVGGIIKLGSASQYVVSGYSDKKFKQDQLGRKVYSGEPLRKRTEYDKLFFAQIESLKSDLEANNSKEYILEKHEGILNHYVSIKDKIELDSIVQAYDLLMVEYNKRISFIAMDMEKSKYKDFIEKKMSEYDKNNDRLSGYSFKWVDFGLNLSNGTYQFKDESINDNLSPAFDDEKSLNKLLAKASINLNFTLNNATKVIYLQLGTSFTSGSFLNSNLIDGTPIINSNQGDDFLIVDENEVIIGSYNNIEEEALQYFDFHGYAAWFFANQKNFGIIVSAQHNFLSKRPEFTTYRNNFSAFFGPVFRTVKGESSGLTFGLDVGFDNAIYNTKITDDFSARLRIGIPFKIYEKKKEKK